MNPNPLRIILVTGSLARGGAERQLYYLAQNLQKNGHQVAVATLDQNEYWEQPLKDLGIPVHCFEGTKSKWGRFKQLRQLSKSWQPDLLYSFHFFTNIYAWYAAWLRKARAFGSIRNDGYFEKRMTGYMSYAHYYLPEKIVANSEHGRTNAQKAFFWKRAIALLPNAVDAGAFPASFVPIVPNQPLRLLFVGRLESQKRPDRLLRWFQKLVATSMLVQLDLAGDGSLRGEMEQLAAALGIAQQVRFLGRVAAPQALMQQAHWLVISSDYEGTPNVVIEALMTGLPVLAHPFEGIVPTLGGCGHICDFDAAPPAIAFLYDEKVRRDFSNRGRAHALEAFSLQAQYSNFIKLC